MGLYFGWSREAAKFQSLTTKTIAPYHEHRPTRPQARRLQLRRLRDGERDHDPVCQSLPGASGPVASRPQGSGAGLQATRIAGLRKAFALRKALARPAIAIAVEAVGVSARPAGGPEEALCL